jgi:hypothetical protein
MRYIFLYLFILFSSAAFAQTFNSTASLIQLQVVDVKKIKEDTSINTCLDPAFSYNYRFPKNIQMNLEVTEKEIKITSQYPKYTKITYSVVRANLPEDGVLTYINPIYFECLTESGDTCKISYSLLYDMSVEQNRDIVNGEKKIVFKIQFPDTSYEYIGHLD